MAYKTIKSAAMMTMTAATTASIENGLELHCVTMRRKSTIESKQRIAQNRDRGRGDEQRYAMVDRRCFLLASLRIL